MPEAHAPDPTGSLDLVTVVRTSNPATLAVAKSVLQAAGIDFATKNEGVQELFGWGRFPRGNNLFMGPVELQVRSDDAPYALGIMEGIAPGDEGPDAD